MKQRFTDLGNQWWPCDFWKHLTISTMPASVALNLKGELLFVRSCCDSACPYTWTSTWNYLGEHPLRTLDAFHAFNAPLEFWDAGFLVANSAELQGVLHHFMVICHGEDFTAFWCKHGWTTWSWDGHCCGRGLGEVRSRALSFVHMIQVRSLQRTESSQGREEPVARALLKIVGTLLQRKDLALARADNLNYREVVGKTWGTPLFVFKMGPRSWGSVEHLQDVRRMRRSRQCQECRLAHQFRSARGTQNTATV